MSQNAVFGKFKHFVRKLRCQWGREQDPEVKSFPDLCFKSKDNEYKQHKDLHNNKKNNHIGQYLVFNITDKLQQY